IDLPADLRTGVRARIHREAHFWHYARVLRRRRQRNGGRARGAAWPGCGGTLVRRQQVSYLSVDLLTGDGAPGRYGAATGRDLRHHRHLAGRDVCVEERPWRTAAALGRILCGRQADGGDGLDLRGND